MRHRSTHRRRAARQSSSRCPPGPSFASGTSSSPVSAAPTWSWSPGSFDEPAYAPASRCRANGCSPPNEVSSSSVFSAASSWRQCPARSTGKTATSWLRVRKARRSPISSVSATRTSMPPGSSSVGPTSTCSAAPTHSLQRFRWRADSSGTPCLCANDVSSGSRFPGTSPSTAPTRFSVTGTSCAGVCGSISVTVSSVRFARGSVMSTRSPSPSPSQ